MALPCYMTIEGKQTGKIDGPSKVKGRENSFELLALSHEVTAGFDGHDVRRAGHTVHHPLEITKEIDAASPKLYQALTQNDSLTVEIKWYRPQPEGGAREQNYFTIKLKDASLSKISPQLPKLTGGQGDTAHPTETIAFVYREITWTADGGGAHTDTWIERG